MSSVFVLKHMSDYIDEFLAEIAPFSNAFDTQVFCFLASAKPNGLHIAQARLHLDSAPSFQAKPIFQYGGILAGQLLLGDHGKTLKEFLTEFATGYMKIGQIDLIFDHPSGVNTSLVGSMRRAYSSRDGCRS